ncbi:hypothetical protein JCM5350_005473 [Sporobolomyces pararoseus]
MSNVTEISRRFKTYYDGILFWIKQIVDLVGNLSQDEAGAQKWGDSLKVKFALSSVESAFQVLRNEDNARKLDDRLQEIFREDVSMKARIPFKVSSLDTAGAIAASLNIHLQHSIGHGGLISSRHKRLYQVDTAGSNADGHCFLY